MLMMMMMLLLMLGLLRGTGMQGRAERCDVALSMQHCVVVVVVMRLLMMMMVGLK